MVLKRLSDEAAAATPGAYTVISRLTDILLIEGIRVWLESESAEGAGWLRALNDPVVCEALGRIHSDPGLQWTVASLAAEVGLSRSAFAAQFTRIVGEAPLRYVTGWRMRLARSWLRGTALSLGDMAERLGYQSEDAFKRAFRREVGSAPGSYRRVARAESLAT